MALYCIAGTDTHGWSPATPYRLLEQVAHLSQDFADEPEATASIPSSFDTAGIDELSSGVAHFGMVVMDPPVLSHFTEEDAAYTSGATITPNTPIFGDSHNGTDPLRFSVDPALPTGLVIDHGKPLSPCRVQPVPRVRALCHIRTLRKCAVRS